VPFGYHGCYLRIDVSRGTVERVMLDAAVLRQYVGGSGLGVRLLLDAGSAHLDPLAPEAPLVFSFSPLVGSPLTTSAKFAVVSKSPLTGRINDSLASSGFAVAGKSCGCDAIMIVGRAPELSVLIIDDGQVRVESAAGCAGKTCQETEAALRSRLGANFRIASIGPVGHSVSNGHTRAS
jgi:aldehyde:ferredoxin oxidoreductase